MLINLSHTRLTLALYTYAYLPALVKYNNCMPLCVLRQVVADGSLHGFVELLVTIDSRGDLTWICVPRFQPQG